MGELKQYVFFTDKLSYYEVEEKGQKKFFVTGYISTTDRDLENDVVSRKAMSNMLQQILDGEISIKFDNDHDTWREQNPRLMPLGKIVEAKQDDKGIFVKAEINRNHKEFKTVWGSIKDKMLDAFSITFKTVDFVYRMVDGIKTRILNEVKLLNVALTGNPINPEARMFDVFTKSLRDSEVTKMEAEEKSKYEDKIKTLETEVKSAEDAKDAAVKEKDEGAEAAKTEAEAAKTETDTAKKEAEDAKGEVEGKAKEVEEKAKKIEALEKENTELKSRLDNPVIKAHVESMRRAAEIKKKSKAMGPLDLI